MRKSVEILCFGSCPNVELTLLRVREAIRAAGMERDVDVQVRTVEGADAARTERFLGSPSVRVDGVDVEPGAESRTDYGMQCRLYGAEGRMDGAPSIAWIERRLRAGASGSEPAGTSRRGEA